MRKVLYLLLLLIGLFTASGVQASEKIVTVVNPVRSRELWKDKSIESLREQYKMLDEKGIKGSWLVQNDVWEDREVSEEIKKFEGQEIGIFLEVSEKVAKRAGVVYPVNRTWYDPGVVFLSAYGREEREKLIKVMMEDFKKEKGEYAQRVGAWWIDSYSLSVLREKYGVETVLICADQKTTDQYGIWGQWWSVPYYASKRNVLEVAKSVEDKNGVVIIQWAMRDPVEAYLGEGKEFSNNSVQANDYQSLGKDIEYFKYLSKFYLEDERNEIGQLTIGLEVGQEAVGNLEEMQRQIEYLSGEGVEFLGMSEFFGRFREVYPGIRERAYIDKWELSTKGRFNSELGESREYGGGVFRDYFVADKEGFLKRVVGEDDRKGEKANKIWEYVLVGLLGALVFLKKKNRVEYLLWMVLSCTLWLRSEMSYGWGVEYGYEGGSEGLIRVAAIVLANLIFWGAKGVKMKGSLLWSFSLWPILRAIKVTVIEGKVWIGVVDTFKFMGLEVSKGGVGVVNKEMLGWQTETLLGFKMEWVWELGMWGWLGVSVVGIIVSWMIGGVLKKVPKKLGVLIKIIMTILIASEIWWLLSKGIERAI